MQLHAVGDASREMIHIISFWRRTRAPSFTSTSSPGAALFFLGSVFASTRVGQKVVEATWTGFPAGLEGTFQAGFAGFEGFSSFGSYACRQGIRRPSKESPRRDGSRTDVDPAAHSPKESHRWRRTSGWGS